MMDGIGYEGIVIDGRRICFEYRCVSLLTVVIIYVFGYVDVFVNTCGLELK